ncbi:MAG: C10 family peptidase [Prevotellaceae bacterium]|jgi:hypothetical protein|nr:C10 family peptidase [Prevotellaceae bacterium]
MRKLFFLAATVATFTFALISCDKTSDAIDAEVSRQKANGKITYVDNVNVEIAQAVAEGFYADASKESSIAYVISIDSIIDWEGKTAIYVFNFSPNGFVLTSADIKNEPIIGYSDKGTFSANANEMPEGLFCLLTETMIVNRWLQEPERERDVEPQQIIHNNMNNWYDELQLKKNNLTILLNPDIIIIIDPCDRAPRTLESTEIQGAFDYYCKTEWGQGEPYNYYAPHYYPAGCVAVAVGQIMRFHEYPAVYNTPIPWTTLPNSSNNPYDSMTTGDMYVAALLRNIGDKVNMNYTSGGSSSNIDKARKALVKEYGYSENADVDKFDYNKIKNELQTQKHPLYVRGDGTQTSWEFWLFVWWTVDEYSDGHAYVIDGVTNLVRTYEYTCMGETKTDKYQTELMHYNFGWGGSYNFWYSNSIVDVAGTYIDRDVIMDDIMFPNFQYTKKCIYNIKP